MRQQQSNTAVDPHHRCPTDVERTAGELINSAASLLVYRAVMTTKPSQAFLRLLQYLQRGTAQQLLEAYGDLYNQLALAGHSSWMDYVLEQVSMDVCFATQH